MQTNIDVSDQYEQMLKELRPWIILFIVSLLSLIITGILFVALDIDKTLILPALAIELIALVLSSIKTFKASYCPNCDGFLGREVGQFCTHCGARLKKDTFPKQ